MSKVKRITVQNLKAVTNQTADFNGCTAIITGGNNKGKTSFLRSLFDRLRGVKPEMILRQGETEGFAEAELTTGEKIKWEFNDKGKGFKEKMTFISEKDIRTAITLEIRNRLTPASFDVDQFLQDPPKKQREALQKLVGLDFTKVDADYKAAYDDRELKNREAAREQTILSGLPVPAKVDAVSTEDLQAKKATEKKRLDDLYEENKKHNEGLRKNWNEACDKLREEIREWNESQTTKANSVSKANEALQVLRGCGYNGEEVSNHIETIKADVQKLKVFEPLPEPDYITELPDQTELSRLDNEIVSAVETNQKAKLYTDYELKKQKSADANKAAADADTKVKSAEKSRMDLIKSAKLPEGFGFSDDGITYKDLPFTREQLSSSGIYIAALKLAAMTLGEIKTLHFDASFLDKNSLQEIEEWATSEDLQLLIERPDFDGGEIEYQILS